MPQWQQMLVPMSAANAHAEAAPPAVLLLMTSKRPASMLQNMPAKDCCAPCYRHSSPMQIWKVQVFMLIDMLG